MIHIASLMRPITSTAPTDASRATNAQAVALALPGAGASFQDRVTPDVLHQQMISARLTSRRTLWVTVFVTLTTCARALAHAPPKENVRATLAAPSLNRTPAIMTKPRTHWALTGAPPTPSALALVHALPGAGAKACLVVTLCLTFISSRTV